MNRRRSIGIAIALSITTAGFAAKASDLFDENDGETPWACDFVMIKPKPLNSKGPTQERRVSKQIMADTLPEADTKLGIWFERKSPHPQAGWIMVSSECRVLH